MTDDLIARGMEAAARHAEEAAVGRPPTHEPRPPTRNGHVHPPDVSDLKITTLADVEAERVEWLWNQRLPRGKLVVFDGDPELGKSTLALTFAATITTGGVWPDGERCQYTGHVLILSAEDGLADTVRPRIDAAGGDPAKVHSIDAAIVVDENGEPVERSITLADVDRLSRAIRYYDAKLVIVDVLMSYMPMSTDSHRDQDVRSIFAPLSRIAADTGCTILVLRHLNKGKGGNPLYRGGGSIAIVGAARVGLLVAKCPSDDDETLCAFAVQKNNLSAKPEVLTYHIVECTNGAGQVQWVGSTDKPIHELLDDTAPPRKDDDEFDDHDYTGDLKRSWLYRYLDEAREAEAQVRPKDAIAMAADKGVSRRSVFRLFNALANAGMAESVDGTKFPRVTQWRLTPPTTDPTAQTGGTTGTTGADLHKQGGTTADLFDIDGTTAETISGQVKQREDSPVVPVVPPIPRGTPPGGITPNTPGMTDRVMAALSKSTQQTQGVIP